MAERKRGIQAKPSDPDLLPSQAAFKTASDEILKHKTNDRLTLVHFRIETDPTELLERIRQSSLRDLLLEPGEPLSMPQPNPRYRDLGLVIGETPATGVVLTHWDWKEKKSRIDPTGPKSPPYKIIKYPGEFDWMREIDIGIWFGEGINRAAQKLSLFDASRSAGIMPQITRDIYAPKYAETGYEGHNRKSRPFRDNTEAMFFVDLARELFEKRKTDASAAVPSSI